MDNGSTTIVVKINEDYTMLICTALLRMAASGRNHYIIGNHFGLGEKFEEELCPIGPTALAMVGILYLPPLRGELTAPVVSPFYRLIGSYPEYVASVVPHMIAPMMAGKFTAGFSTVLFAHIVSRKGETHGGYCIF